MTSGRRGARAAAGAVALGVAMTLAACSQEGLTAAERSRATTLPTPTKPGVDAAQTLRDRLGPLLASPAMSVDEDLVVDGTETATRLSWGSRGAVVDASVLTIGTSGPGTEVYRSPNALLVRHVGNGDSCWWQGGSSEARFDRPIAQEIAVLRSAQGLSGDASLVKGSVDARSVLRVIGTDDQLRSRDLLPPAGVQVAATFGVSEPGVEITISWSDLVAAAGNSSRHTRTGTWTLRYQPLASGGPTAPAADHVVSVAQTDPTFPSALRACNARIQ